MKNQVDFLKINGGVWGAINFNNMIPIHSDQLERIDMRILPTDDKATVDYKNLLANQLSWCNTSANATSIIQKAEKLYRIITSKTARPQLAKRCCDFRVLEVAMNHYIDCQHMQDDSGLMSAMAKLNPVTHTQEQPATHDKEQDWTY